MKKKSFMMVIKSWFFCQTLRSTNNFNAPWWYLAKDMNLTLSVKELWTLSPITWIHWFLTWWLGITWCLLLSSNLAGMGISSLLITTGISRGWAENRTVWDHQKCKSLGLEAKLTSKVIKLRNAWNLKQRNCITYPWNTIRGVRSQWRGSH